MSPLRYQKRLRLPAARRLMLGEGQGAALAAFRVGYESPSQFSLDHRRTSGAPPRQHVLAVERETPKGQIEPIGVESPMARLSPTLAIGPDGRIGFSFCYCLLNVIFPEAGVYQYRIKIDSEELGAAKILVAAPERG